MKIEDILKKQGEIYKDLPEDETIKKCNETIEKPPKSVPYKENLSEQENKAITEIKNLLYKKIPAIDKSLIPKCRFGYTTSNCKIMSLHISNYYLESIPKQINDLTDLLELSLSNNKITKIENLDNLTNLRKLDLSNNEIKEINGLDNLKKLREVYIQGNPITSTAESKHRLKKLRKKKVYVEVEK